MDSTGLSGLLEFLRGAEQLKNTMRSAHTSTGRHESSAEHTWRLCLMACMLHRYRSDVDLARLLELCVVHDLGEAVNGDIPAPQQAQAAAGSKAQQERDDLLHLANSLPSPLRDDLIALWDEYEEGATPEARLTKALDRLETILQHTQGRNPEDFDYRFNLDYGRAHTSDDQLTAALREEIDKETEIRARRAENANR